MYRVETQQETKGSLNLQNLKKPLQEIIDFAESINEKYREKCFEVLVNFYLLNNEKLVGNPLSSAPEPPASTIGGEVKLPIDVRAFLQQNGLEDKIVQGLFIVDNEEIRPTYKITTTRKSSAQIQIALLAALENAVKKQGNKFEFSREAVRQRCIEQGVYDKKNFMTHFKNNLKFFKNLNDIIEISPIGQTELAEVITLVSK